MSAGENTLAPAGSGRARWLWILLTASVALNLLFVGLFAGSWWTRGGHRESRNQVATGAIERLMKGLPEQKRTLAAGLIQQHNQSVKPVRDQLREARRTARDAVLTEPYDEAKVGAALERFRQIRNDQHQSMHTMMLGLMKELTLEEREQLLEFMREGFRKRAGRWKKDDKPKN